MSKIGESLLKGAQEALSYAKGMKKGAKAHQIKVPKVVNVRAIRDKLNMSRSDFAALYGFSERTLRKVGTRSASARRRSKSFFDSY